MELKEQRFDRWTFGYNTTKEGNVPMGGLVLKKVMHDEYNLSKDIRVVAIWLNDITTPVILGSDICVPLGNIEILDAEAIERSGESNATENFSVFPIIGAIRQKYVMRKPYHGLQTAGLEIIQTYLFTSYDLYPAHEPFGVLKAARLFPLIEFKFKEDNTTDTSPDIKIKRIRIDYRLHNSVDFFYDVKGLKIDPGLVNYYPDNENPQGANMAGIFRDNDDPPSLLGLLGSGIKGFVVDKGHPGKALTNEQLFFAAEKPLQYEIFGFGLINGLPFGSDKGNDILTWDNIHQWGGYKGYKQLPSTPGAFHAVHLHWRWGLVSQRMPKGFSKWLLKAAGLPQFRGSKIDLGFGVGGPLVDSSIPMQTIRFAVTKSRSNDDDIDSKDPQNANKEPSERYFEKLFYNDNQKPPEEIKNGEDIVAWLSFEVIRQNFFIPFHGTVFIHGLYFAHNLEDGWFFAPSELSRGVSAPKKKVVRKWNRNPSDSMYKP